MNMNRQFIRSSVLGIILLASLLSCGKEAVAKTPAATTEAPVSTEETVVDNTVKTNLPEDLDFNEAEFLVYAYNRGGNPPYISNDRAGDVVDDARAKSNTLVEERLNCKINCEEPIAGVSGMVALINNAVMSGDDVCDVADIHICENVNSLITTNAIYNYREMPYLEFSQPYYNQRFNDLFTINDQLYIISSSYVDAGGLPLLLFFNKDMMLDLDLEIPYDIVFDGKWTFDVFREYCKDVYQDIDNIEGVSNDDRFAIADGPYSFSYMMAGFNINTVEVDADGKMVPNLVSEKLVTALTMLNDLYWSGNSVYHDGKDVFFNGNALFTNFLSGFDKFRSIDDFDIGILPFPKYDEEQETYGSYYAANYFVSPTTLRDPEKTGAVLEALSAEYYNYVRPATTEQYIEQKLLRDEESVKIYEMLNENSFIEFSRYYPFSSTISCYEHICNLIEKHNNDLASWASKNEKNITKQFDKLYTQFED